MRRCGSREPWGSCSLPACQGPTRCAPLWHSAAGSETFVRLVIRGARPALPRFPQTVAGREDLTKTPTPRPPRRDQGIPSNAVMMGATGHFRGFCRTEGMASHGSRDRMTAAQRVPLRCASAAPRRSVGTVGDPGPRDHTPLAQLKILRLSSKKYRCTARVGPGTRRASTRPLGQVRTSRMRGASEGQRVASESSSEHTTPARRVSSSSEHHEVATRSARRESPQAALSVHDISPPPLGHCPRARVAAWPHRAKVRVVAPGSRAGTAHHARARPLPWLLLRGADRNTQSQ